MTPSTPLRRMKPTRRADLSDLRKALEDGKLWAALGTVTVPEDAPSHYSFVDADGHTVADAADAAELLVEVLIVPDNLPLTCRLGAGFGGNGAGLWEIPDVGTEVAVLLPSGAIDFRPIIVDVLASGVVPARVAPGRTVLVSRHPLEIIAPSIIATDAGGQALALATKDDLDALADAFAAHIHQVAGVSAGVTTVPSTPPTGSTPSAAGTSILRAK